MKAIISASAIVALAFLSLSTTPVHSFQSGCPTNGPLSCPTPTMAVNDCCVEVASGQFILSQAWDVNPSVGPANSFVISRLLTDKCDGTFEQNCDASRDYTGISDLLNAQGPPGFLSKMQTFWPADAGNQDEQLWEQVWAASGTCLSTLDLSCLPAGSPMGADAVAYFNATMNLFESLPTYQWLSNAKVLPSSDQTYTLDNLISVLQSTYGYTPAIECKDNVLIKVNWYFNLKGSFADGEFVPFDAPQSSTCASSGIQYLPKTTTAQ
ncbi:hypothetical protein EMPS_07138 [Entomortierella parvispora]|uniref:Uncharacterized protein n=1 Tax=Entomortierella parvispora TaxID=205924 RepID=A0A9P3HDY7_9FUNG|nr:hypothetical protein EMPS_07138 [Entomortierella parvispora]